MSALNRAVTGLLQRRARGHPEAPPARVVRVVKFFAENQRSLSQREAQFVFTIFPQIALLWLRHFSTFQNPADGEAAGKEGRREKWGREWERPRAKSQVAVWAHKYRHGQSMCESACVYTQGGWKADRSEEEAYKHLRCAGF